MASCVIFLADSDLPGNFGTCLALHFKRLSPCIKTGNEYCAECFSESQESAAPLPYCSKPGLCEFKTADSDGLTRHGFSKRSSTVV